MVEKLGNLNVGGGTYSVGNTEAGGVQPSTQPQARALPDPASGLTGRRKPMGPRTQGSRPHNATLPDAGQPQPRFVDALAAVAQGIGEAISFGGAGAGGGGKERVEAQGTQAQGMPAQTGPVTPNGVGLHHNLYLEEAPSEYEARDHLAQAQELGCMPGEKITYLHPELTDDFNAARSAAFTKHGLPLPPDLANASGKPAEGAPGAGTRDFSFATDSTGTDVQLNGYSFSHENHYKQNHGVGHHGTHGGGHLHSIAPGVNLQKTEREARRGVKELDHVQHNMMGEVGQVMNIGNTMQLQMSALKVIQDLISALSKTMSKMAKAVSDMA